MSEEKLREYLKRVTGDLRRTRRDLEQLRLREREPIAVVSVGCRFPGGVRSAQDLWLLLEEERDAIDGFPRDRGWTLSALDEREQEGDSCPRQGGFLYDAADFDAELFGIAPREARAVDPQQRLLLEVSWEACERARIDPHALSGSDTGVFAGVFNCGYGSLLGRLGDPYGHRLTGSADSVVSGRVAYSLGLRGPAISVDTACSSSLVALHLACQALRRGECSLALAGGVTVMALPDAFVDFARQQGLAADGRCKSFAHAADGTSWSEGVGVLLLERFSDARRHGHDVLALIRGSAVNQDGASNGLTAPNGPSQRRVILNALRSAGLTAEEIDAVEAHGTGTRLGDPIEAQALLAVHAGRPSTRPLRLGSIKSNIGHAQAAAGVAGVIKMIMALQREQLPKTLHVDEPTREVDWSSGAVSLLTEPVPWRKRPDGPRRAGVSAFGISGTNAHLILEEPPADPRGEVERPARRPPKLGLHAWVLSGRGEQALRAQAGRLSAHLASDPDCDPGDVELSLIGTRAALTHRAVVIGPDPESLRKGLASVGENPDGGLSGSRSSRSSVVTDVAIGERGRCVAFLFTGQGAQRVGMGGELYRVSDAFRQELDRVCAELDPLLGCSLLEKIVGSTEGERSADEGNDDLRTDALRQTALAQTSLFALEVALASLLEQVGVRPDFVIGHSVGELAAAHVAGALSLTDACALVAARGRLMGQLPARGAMVAVRVTEHEARERLVGLEKSVSLAAVNGPSSVVVSGERGAVLKLAEEWQEQGVKTSRLNVSHAFHSPLVEDALEELRQVAADVHFEEPRVPLVSNVSGEQIEAAELCSPDYWVRHARETVRFGDGVRWLHAQGVGSYLELGPDAVLSSVVEECLGTREAGGPFGSEPAGSTSGSRSGVGEGAVGAEAVAAIPLMRRRRPEALTFLNALGRLWARGAHVRWNALLEGSGAQSVSLPTYAFQRSRFWPEATESGGDQASFGQPPRHPLLSAGIALADGRGWAFTGRLSVGEQAWLADHRVAGRPLLAATAFLDLALYTALQTGSEAVGELTLQAPLVLPEDGAARIQAIVGEPGDGGERSIEIYSCPERSGQQEQTETEEWVCHARGTLVPGPPLGGDRPPVDGGLSVWPPRGAEALELGQVYEALGEIGLDYGPAFRGLRAAWRRERELFADVALPEQEHARAGLFQIHPALLDACLHALALDGSKQAPESKLRLPFSWSRVALHRPGATALRVCIGRGADGDVSIELADEDGRALGSIGSLVTREAAAADLLGPPGSADRAYELRWRPLVDGLQTGKAPERWAAVGFGKAAREQLRSGPAELSCHRDLESLLDSLKDNDGLAPDAVLLDATGLGDTDPRSRSPLAAGSCELGSSAQAMPQRAELALSHLLELTQLWIETELASAPLAVITQGAVANEPDEGVRDLPGAAVWGMIRSAAVEHPGRFLLVDLDDDPASWATLAAVLSLDEPQVSIRRGQARVARLVCARSVSAPALSNGVSGGQTAAGDSSERRAPLAGGAVLITGGTGALGAALARHLAGRGVSELVLVSRSGRDAPGAEKLASELAALGARAEIRACDVSERAQVDRLLASGRSRRPLRAVVHAAGTLDDGVISSLTVERLRGVLGSKLAGAWHLHEATRGLDLDAFVLFSSLAGSLGSAGQANYAAANAFLDGLAAHRHAQALPAVSISWGPWLVGDGMAAGLGSADMTRMADSGLLALDLERGLELFDFALAGDSPLVVAADFDLRMLRKQARSQAVAPLMRELAPAPARTPRERAPGGGKLAAASDSERPLVALELVLAHTAEVLGHASKGSIEPAQAFKDMGLDSLGAVELRNRLSGEVGRPLPATLVFDRSTPSALVDYLLEIFVASAGVASGTPASFPPRRSERSPKPTEREPVAIVGMACRYPGGVRSPEDLWELVEQGVDAIEEFPSDRGWDVASLYDTDPERSGASYTRHGGFVEDASEFDAELFGIGPREALAMDPQQRLLLEVTWEALEDARLRPDSLRGSNAGVFVGVMYHDYGTRASGATREALEAYLGMGSAGSIASGRIAYTFGFEGPAVTIDTACSSSLVALHLACGALRAGECDLALAGGATILSTPGVFVEFSRQRGLAPDGRARSYSDTAAGTGWAEGVGVLALERLADARRHGHPVLALVSGSAVNQDGKSNGLTAPSGPAQERVIAQALAAAGLSPADVDVVEGHGTGTKLGDPIEVGALLATYGRDRRGGQPLLLGSIKSNIGHTQAAAGVAGVIKMTMALQRGALPRSLYSEHPSGQVDWSQGEVTLLDEQRQWLPGPRPRRAGISSFGVSGTNAHAILEEVPVLPDQEHGGSDRTGGERDEQSRTRTVAWPLSGAAERALSAQAGRLLAHLERNAQLSSADVSLSLTRRAELEHRAVAVGSDRRELLEALASVADGGAARGARIGKTSPSTGRCALLFSGQGSQRSGMGRELASDFPVFRQALERVATCLDDSLPRPLLDVLFAPDGSDDAVLLEQTMFTQVALFALEVALFEQLTYAGLRPDFLIGHSIGEIAAVHAAGALSLEDACALVGARGRLMGELPGDGAMVAIEASEPEALESLRGSDSVVALAAVNGPRSVTVSGERASVEALEHRWRERGRKTHRLRVSHAFHSPLIEPALERLVEVARGLSFTEPAIPVVSNVDGEILVAERLADPHYWATQARQPVRFAAGVDLLRRLGVRRYLEVGPGAALTAMCHDCLAGPEAQATAGDGSAEEERAVLACTLREGRSEGNSLLGALADLWVDGAALDWSALLKGSDARDLALPKYAFQRKRYWIEAETDPSPTAVAAATTGHPLLSAALPLAGRDSALFAGVVSLRSHPWLGEHVVTDRVLLPGAAMLDLALHAGQALGCPVVHELTLETPLELEQDTGVAVQVSVGEPDEQGRRPIEIHACPTMDRAEGDLERDWTRYASGTVAPSSTDRDASLPLQDDAASRSPLGGSWPPPGAQSLSIAGLYERLAADGLDYGPSLQCLHAAWRLGDQILAEVVSPAESSVAPGSFALNPVLLDAALHAIALSDADGERLSTGAAQVPFNWSDVELLGPSTSRLRVCISVEGESSFSLALADEHGAPVASVGSLSLRAARAARERARGDRSLLRLDWSRLERLPPASELMRWATLERSESPQLPTRPPSGVLAGSYRDLDSLLGDDSLGRNPPDAVLVDCRFKTAGETTGAAGETAGAAGETAGAVREHLAQALDLLQRWLVDERLGDARLVLLTGGAVAARPTDPPPSLTGAALWGLVRAAQAESPGRVVLIDGDSLASCWRRLPVALAAVVDLDEPQLAVRGNELLVPRLVRVPVSDGPAASTDAAGACFDEDGTVLITGAGGALGGALARHLVSARGVRHLVLASRRGSDAASSAELQAELERLGASVSMKACDVADREQVRRLIEAISPERPLRGVVHAAGVLEDGLIGSLSAAGLDRVLAPKLDGALNLHELTFELDLSAFVLFSSAAATLGSAGQANYAAANAALDALASQRRASGLPGLSLAWGPWRDTGGMAASLSEEDRARIARTGVGALSPVEGLALFDAACSADAPVSVPLGLNTSALRARAREGTLSPALRGLVRAPARRRRYSRGHDRPFARELVSLPEAKRRRMVLELVRGEAANVLGHDGPAAIPPQRPFRDLGFDSLASVELRNRLGALTGLRLPATAVFDHPSAGELADRLLGQLTGRLEHKRAAPSRGAYQDEPIAIVGMACRYPGGADSPGALWELLARGGDAISPFPTDRGWDLERLYDPDLAGPGTTYAREGGFLHDAADFDAAFFRIGPREALAMDPQQRLLLEVAWEAIEDAGIDPASLRGTATGVFAGCMYQDYASRIDGAVAAELEGYLGTGTAASILSGRVAYAYGFEGPAVTVDTACSSSLVALHLACRSLRGEECSLALAGGVSVMWTPGTFVEFARQRGLAADGRCKSFAEGADGTGWGEGVGVLVLERLSDASRLGHPVLATVRGSAINQDGASNGLTAPRGSSQEQVIGQALADAGLRVEDIDAVEGHGTGTALGDPIEAQALIATYGRERSDEDPLWLGSLKSNIGHTQAAAGVAGVIKMVLAMRHGVLPRTLHVDRPSTRIDWSSGAVSLLDQERPWPDRAPVRRAAVSSFGLSGTNSHVILERPSPQPAAESADVGARDDLASVPWLLSARGGEPALRAQAERLLEALADGHAASAADGHAVSAVDGHVAVTVDGQAASASNSQAASAANGLAVSAVDGHAAVTVDGHAVSASNGQAASAADVALALARRPQLETRAAIVGEDRERLCGAVAALASSRHDASLVLGEASSDGDDPGLALLFSGQGSQRVGMGAELCRSLPLFASELQRVCERFDDQLEQPLLEVMLREGTPASAGEEGNSALDRTAYAQPALFAFEVALYRQIERWGLRAQLLIGHSIGEVVAAHVAGVLSLEDACTLVAARGRLMQELPAGGAMVAIEASARELEPTLAELEEKVSLAAVNSPRSVVLSGDSSAVLKLAAEWRKRGRRTRRLRVSHAFHSPRMEPMLERFRAVLETLSFEPPRIAVVSNLTGESVEEQLRSPDYWVRQVREPVRFEDCVGYAARAGVSRFLEIGPDGTLAAMARECVEGSAVSSRAVIVSALRARRAERSSLLDGLAALWTAGEQISWADVLAEPRASAVKLPTYAFQRRRYWLSPVEGAPSAVERAGDHPLLDSALRLGGERGLVLTGRVSPRSSPWLDDHVVLGRTLLPGTALLEMALHAGAEVGAPRIEELTIERPLALPGADGSLQLQVVVGAPDREQARSIGIYARSGPEREWTTHATGLLGATRSPSARGRIDAAASGEWPPPGSESLEVDGLYERLANLGFDYGPSFRAVRAAWSRGGEIFGEIGLQDDERVDDGFAIHPALLDAAFHMASDAGRGAAHEPAAREAAEHEPAAREAAEHEPAARVPFCWQGVELFATGARSLRLRLVLDSEQEDVLQLFDGSGAPVISIGSLVARPISTDQVEADAEPAPDSLLVPIWRPADRAAMVSVAEAPSAAGTQSTVRVAVFGGRPEGPAQALAAAAGLAVETLPHLDALVASTKAGRPAPDLVLVDCTQTPPQQPGPADASEGVDGARALEHKGRHGARDDTPLASAHAIVASTLTFAQAALAEPALAQTTVVFVTREALAALPEDRLDGLAGAPVWGLIRSAQKESPGRFALVDVDCDWSECGSGLANALAAVRCEEPAQLAVRGGELLVPRLTCAVDLRPADSGEVNRVLGGGGVDGASGGGGVDGASGGGVDRVSGNGAVDQAPGSPEGERSSDPWLSDPQATILITGGTGGLGATIARHLVEDRGARRLLLLSRSGPSAAGAGELRSELSDRGAEVDVRACDVGDRSQLVSALDAIDPEHPLKVVVHAAGVSDNALLQSLTPERLERVLRSKLDGAFHLHELTAERCQLDAFVLFSSTSALLGGPGQGNYAAANAFLDALACRRRAHGLPATSMAWGLWSEVGMGADLGALDARRMAGTESLRPIAVAAALRLFDAALERSEPIVLPAQLDRAALRREARSGSAPALLSDLAEAFGGRRRASALGVRASTLESSASDGALAQAISTTIRERRLELLEDAVREEVAAVLGHASGQEVDPDTTFRNLGFDSLAGVELRNRLDPLIGRRLPATLVFDHPTCAALARYLLELLSGERLASASRPAIVAAQEPIAIVGIGCRYPGGVRSAEQLWELVRDGVDAITAFPADRGWDVDALYDPTLERPGTSYTREGGFLHDAGEFDAGFFGISPREALAMDPQQRLLLECAWEACENAGVDPLSLAGSPTGVFVGMMTHDYAVAVAGSSSAELEGYLSTGNAGSVASGRVAYSFGLEGPAVTVDTACSSSLVAVHLARQALCAGECSLALAGGASVLATPSMFVDFSRQRALSPDGRCKAFSADADGAGWSEGVGLLVLERLSDARRNGHPVLALVRGSAVNQDGASNGLTAPNGPSQERVIRQALESAGVDAGEIDAVEAHGTGTSLGDPIEAQALIATYGQERSGDLPLWIGSIKSNLGHSLAAAGVAGVIKMAMALERETLAPSIHAEQLSGEIDWSAAPISVLRQNLPWPRSPRPRLAGVSSFGISGTNAHLILEEPPSELARESEAAARPAADDPVSRSSRQRPGAAQEPPIALAGLAPEVALAGGASALAPAGGVSAGLTPAGGPSAGLALAGAVPLVLSARGEAALRAQAARLLARLSGEEQPGVLDVGYSLAVTRAALEHRAVVVGESRVELAAALGSLARGEHRADIVRGVAARRGARTAFLFSGQGCQRAGMGSELHAAFPVFARTLDELCERLDAELAGYNVERPLREVLFAPPGTDEALLIDRTAYAQAGLFALEVALYRLLEDWGCEPSALLGHSIGELAAAHVAGVFDVSDACRLVAARGGLMQALPAGGAMVAVQASEPEILPCLEDIGDRVGLAAVNGPCSVVLSGAKEDVLALAAQWRERERKTKRLTVSHAFHSPLIDAMLDGFRAVAETITFAPPSIPLISGLTGNPADGELLCDPDYWVRHAREPVRFADGVAALLSRRVAQMLELGPDGVLSAMAGECREQLEDVADGMPISDGRAPGEFGKRLDGTSASDGPAAGESLPDRSAAPESGPPDGEERDRHELLFAPLLREGRPEGATLVRALASSWAEGGQVGWGRVFAGSNARCVALPTYPFQLERYWLAADGASSDAARLGQSSAKHPLLSAKVELAGGRGTLFTGRLSLESQPWLADHAVMDTALLPGAAFVELALHASGAVGAGPVEELTVEAPLVLVPGETRQLQVTVEPPDDVGTRALSIHSRPEGFSQETGEPGQWTRHASGVLAADGSPAAPADGASVLHEALAHEWPPAGAQPAQLATLYDELLAVGFDYGPTFRCLKSAWRSGEDVYAQLSLGEPERTGAEPFAVHPALLDAALHAIAFVSAAEASPDAVSLPFSWSGIHCHGVAAGDLRLALRAAADGSYSLALANPDGALVVSVERLVLREVSRRQLNPDGEGGSHGTLLALEWPELERAAPKPPVERLVLLGDRVETLAGSLRSVAPEIGVHDDLYALLGAGARGEEAPAFVLMDCRASDSVPSPVAARELLNGVLETLQAWLLEQRLSASRLVVCTRGAVATDARSGVPDLAGAGVWGLVSSAQAEHPGRFGLLDLDDDPASFAAIASLAGRFDLEPRIALRGGTAFVPRLRALAGGSSAPNGSDGRFGGSGTVLLTGGTGGIGALLAERLVVGHGVRELLLVSRGGERAGGAPELQRRLRALGARVRIAACDVADREQVASLLASIPARAPLRAVIHAAGSGENALMQSLTSTQLERALAAKVDGALHLHELTAGQKLDAFVLISSMAGLFGGPGQANYAAANSLLDALACERRARGLAASSMVWGLWKGVGLGRELGELDMRRMAGSAGIGVLTPGQGVALFDDALACDSAIVAPARLNRGALRSEALAGTLPALLRGLVEAPPASSAAREPVRALAAELAAMSPNERELGVRDLVAREVAAVLGYAGSRRAAPTSTFKSLGFDSLAAVELRNRLARATGLRLPATLIFDYPTSEALSLSLLEELALEETAELERELSRLESTLASMATDDARRERVVARLRGLLGDLDSEGSPSVAMIEGEPALQTASAEEIYEFIDRELGSA